MKVSQRIFDDEYLDDLREAKALSDALPGNLSAGYLEMKALEAADQLRYRRYQAWRESRDQSEHGSEQKTGSV